MKNKLLNIYKTRWFWLIEHMFFIGVPITLLYISHNNFYIAYTGFAITIIYMFLTNRFTGGTLGSFGLQRKYFQEALHYITIPTLVAATLIIFAKLFLPIPFVAPNVAIQSMFLYILISVPLQELLFRGYCLWRCSISFKNIAFIIIFNSCSFAMYHMIFENMWFVAGVFILNLYWSYAFLKYRNLYAFMLSHALLGVLYFIPIQL